jgi:hypothetical protein
MRRKSSFQRDSELQAEFRRINKLVQNKQSKLRRQEGLEVVDVSTQKFKEFNSKRQVTSYLKEMESFLHNEKTFTVENKNGVQMDYQVLKQVQKDVKRTNKQKAKAWDQVKDLEFKYRGNPTGLTVKEQASPKVGYGDTRFADLEPIKFDPQQFTTQKHWERRRDQLVEVYGGRANYLKDLNKLYRENYLKAMDDALGSDSKKLQKHIKKMKLNDFMVMAFTEKNAHINFIYDKLSQQARISELKNIWGYVEEETK